MQSKGSAAELNLWVCKYVNFQIYISRSPNVQISTCGICNLNFQISKLLNFQISHRSDDGAGGKGFKTMYLVVRVRRVLRRVQQAFHFFVLSGIRVSIRTSQPVQSQPARPSQLHRGETRSKTK